MHNRDFDRKLNIVISGIAECPKGTHRYDRFNMDEQSVVKVLTSLVPTLSPQSIKDCYRLGKYRESNHHPRPLLVQLNRTRDVSHILAKRGSLSSPGIRIKPDLSADERKSLSLLLAERKALIDSNMPRSAIKIRENRLYVNNLLHASVSDGALLKHPTLGDLSPRLHHFASQSSSPLPNAVTSGSSNPPSTSS